MPSLDTQTRDLILAYLGGELALDDLRRRFMSIAWGLDEDSATRDPLSATVSLHLAEFSREHHDVSELRKLLASLVETVLLRYAATPFSLQTGVSTPTQSAQWPRLVAAGT